MPIACLLVEELLVGEREHRTVAVRLDFDRHQRFALRLRLPSPGEDKLLIRHEFAINAADIMLFAGGALHQPTIKSPNVWGALVVEHFDFARTHPAFYFFLIVASRENLGPLPVELGLE